MNYKCKCGNITDFFIEKKGNNTGLYCSKCGKWITWLNKDQIRAFEHGQSAKVGTLSDIETIDDKNKAIALTNAIELSQIKENLKSFISFLEKEIDKREIYDETASFQESNRLASEIIILNKNKNALINILNGKDWNEVD